MPEEINRVVTDALAELLWTPSPDADENLRGEGIPPERIERVGNIMIDCYEMMRPQIARACAAGKLGLAPKSYGVVTLHRPSNVDDRSAMRILVDQLKGCAQRLPLVFPVHPRTRARLKDFELYRALTGIPGMRMVEPMGYIDFMSLMTEARLAITDSGGIQEEATYLDIPCLTVRSTTERPITITQGTNRLVQPDALETAVEKVLLGDWPRGKRPALWDGKTASRVARSLQIRSGC